MRQKGALRNQFLYIFPVLLLILSMLTGCASIHFIRNDRTNPVYKLGSSVLTVEDLRILRESLRASRYPMTESEDELWKETKEEALALISLAELQRANSYPVSKEKREKTRAALKKYLNTDEAKSYDKESFERLTDLYLRAKSSIEEITKGKVRMLSLDDVRTVRTDILYSDSESRLKEARARIEKGESFASLQREFGQTPGSMPVQRGDLIEALDKILFSMKEGELSKVIPADGRYYLLHAVFVSKTASESEKDRVLHRKVYLAWFHTAEEYLKTHTLHVWKAGFDDAMSAPALEKGLHYYDVFVTE